MATRAKIAISLAPEVLALVDKHAAGRSRSRAIEEELLRALRAREWERLSAQLDPADAKSELAWAESAWGDAHDQLSREEGARRPPAKPRRRSR